MDQAGEPPMTSRLMTEEEAAAYLAIPRAALRRMTVGRVNVGGRWRWDRKALDADLDRKAGLVTARPPPTGSTPDDLLDQWLTDEAAHA